MKKSLQILDRMTMALLIALCLFSMAVPAEAADPTTAPEDIRYGIIIECSYSDIEHSDTSDRSIYEENFFLLSSKTSELYAIAEYSEGRQTYVVTDYTPNRDSATWFRCGTDGKLQISGISPDSYILDQMQTATGYTIAFNTELDFSSATAMVNGNEMDTSIDPDTGEMIAFLPIALAKGFDLPDVCGGCRIRAALICSGIALIAGIILIVFIFSIKQQKKLSITDVSQ